MMKGNDALQRPACLVGAFIGLLALVPFFPAGISAAAEQKPVGAGSAASAGAREARIDYLKKHAVAIRTLDARDGDFADLEPLREVIGDRRIVMLGEATHGDGATFAAKVRLIKFLHERMGFDVLAFECGFYDMSRVWSALRAGEDPGPAFALGVDDIWRSSRQTQPLWSYLAERAKTSRPLELAGFDMQFTGRAPGESLLRDLGGYLAGAGLPPDAAAAAARVMNTLALVCEDPAFIQNGSRFKNVLPEDQAAFLIASDDLGRALGRLHPPDEPGRLERDFWAQVLKSNATYLEQSWHINLAALDKTPMIWAFDLRDRQMGDNFIWLAKRAYPTRKIVVWSATAHIARHHNFLMSLYDPMISMGDWIDRELGPEVYALGFTAYQGRWGTVGMAEPKDVAPAAPDSLEDLLFSAGFAYAWLDFRNLAADGAWLRAPLAARPLRYEPMTADWTRLMDGLFFIRETYPSPRAGNK
jgi:erythromycin esterase